MLGCVHTSEEGTSMLDAMALILSCSLLRSSATARRSTGVVTIPVVMYLFIFLVDELTSRLFSRQVNK